MVVVGVWVGRSGKEFPVYLDAVMILVRGVSVACLCCGWLAGWLVGSTFYFPLYASLSRLTLALVDGAGAFVFDFSDLYLEVLSH